MKIKAFITHKLAEKYKDCQDRFCISKSTKSIAISDGMSQSIFQDIWAELLTNSFVSTKDFKLHDNLKDLTEKWREKVDSILEQKRKDGIDPWRAENSLAKGLSAGATFCGLRFDRNEWSCQVLGDSSLIVLNHDFSIKTIFSSQDGEFDNHPDYFDSNPNKEGKGTLKENSGKLQKGDFLLLVTDPFSDYFYEKHRNNAEVELIKQIVKISNHKEFCSLVDEWREQGMHNDDSTIIVIEYDENDEFNVIHTDDIEKLICKESEEAKKNLESPLQETKKEENLNADKVETSKVIVNESEQLTKIDTIEKTITKNEFLKKKENVKSIYKDIFCNKESKNGFIKYFRDYFKGKKQNKKNEKILAFDESFNEFWNRIVKEFFKE